MLLVEVALLLQPEMGGMVMVVMVRVVVEAVVRVEDELQVDAGGGERHLRVALAAAGPEAAPPLLDRAIAEPCVPDLPGGDKERQRERENMKQSVLENVFFLNNNTKTQPFFCRRFFCRPQWQ